MKTAIKLLPIVTAGLLTALPAQAALFDFATIADTEGEQGFAAFTRTVDSVQLTATATSVGDADDTPDYFAYLDESFNGNRGGMGVCKELDSSSECGDSTDDNLGAGELLTLAFDNSITLDTLWFRSFDHTTTFDENAQFLLSIDGGAFTAHNLTHMFSMPMVGSTFAFRTDDAASNPYYIEMLSVQTADVPEPAALGLLGMGLLGLGWRQRRRGSA